jgi:hypothetical protein
MRNPLAAPHNTPGAHAQCLRAASVAEVLKMLEITQEILDKVNPLLDAADVDSAAKVLADVDPTSLRALLIHILRERGSSVADAVGEAYLREHAAARHTHEAA